MKSETVRAEFASKLLYQKNITTKARPLRTLLFLYYPMLFLIISHISLHFLIQAQLACRHYCRLFSSMSVLPSMGRYLQTVKEQRNRLCQKQRLRSCMRFWMRWKGDSKRASYGRTLLSVTCEKHTALLNTATTMTGCVDSSGMADTIVGARVSNMEQISTSTAAENSGGIYTGENITAIRNCLKSMIMNILQKTSGIQRI